MTREELFRNFPPAPKDVLDQPFFFAIIGGAHPHIHEMCRHLLSLGAQLKYIHDLDSIVQNQLCRTYPQALAATEAEILDDPTIFLIVSAAIPSRRAEIGIRSMEAGKDYLVDKAPMTTLEQISAVRQTCIQTGRKCFIFYGESVCNEGTLLALDLVRRGVIGNVFHITGSAPHRLNAPSRPAWFFQREFTGGILIDLACHQIHQFLEFADADSAHVDMGRTANHQHPQFPGFDDFGDADCTASNGITGHFHVDWFSPAGLQTWGDSRMFIHGTSGTIELRKNCDLTRHSSGSHVYVVTRDGEFYENVTGKVPITFFSDLLHDCVYRTDTAMNFQRAFAAIELAIRAQQMAQKYRSEEL